MFVGREQELASLEEFYAKDGIGMTVIYGRRRIGKSTLITEFVKDKKTVFYTATKIGKTRNLELFSKQVLDLFMPGIENISFNSIEAVFDFIDKNIANDKIVLVIDELPYWAEKDDSLLSILQKYIDTIDRVVDTVIADINHNINIVTTYRFTDLAFSFTGTETRGFDIDDIGIALISFKSAGA